MHRNAKRLEGHGHKDQSLDRIARVTDIYVHRHRHAFAAWASEHVLQEGAAWQTQMCAALRHTPHRLPSAKNNRNTRYNKCLSSRAPTALPRLSLAACGSVHAHHAVHTRLGRLLREHLRCACTVVTSHFSVPTASQQATQDGAGTRAKVFLSHCLCSSGLASTKSLTCARTFWKLLWPSSAFLPSPQAAMLSTARSSGNSMQSELRALSLSGACLCWEGPKPLRGVWLASTHEHAPAQASAV